MLNFVFAVFAFLRYRFQFEHNLDFYLCLLLINFSRILAFVFIRKKVFYSKKGFKIRLIRIFKRSVVFFLFEVLLFLPLLPIIGYLWSFMLAASLFFVSGKLLINYLFFITIRHYHLKNSRVNRVLLVGKNKTMQKVKNIIKANPVLKYLFVGYLDDVPGKEVLGSTKDLKAMIQEYNIHMIFVSVKNSKDIKSCCGLADDLLYVCNQLGVRLFYVPENKGVDAEQYDVEKIEDVSIINPQKIPMDMIENQIKKRLFDLFFSGLVILLVMSWLYPVLAILIKLSSKGPVLFTQKRTGINKITFDCYKFRSMRVNKDADLKQATEDDPRITKIGKFIRKTNLDELPQFFNVFKGDMSVVGPRPHMLAHTEQYSALIKDYLVRHYVKPGITGWAQINGFRGETDQLWKMEKRVEMDKEYIRNWSLDWDVVIVWKTVFDLKAFLNAR